MSNLIWKKLRHLGILKSKNMEKLIFSTDELNEHFTNYGVSPNNQITDIAFYIGDNVYMDLKFY